MTGSIAIKHSKQSYLLLCVVGAFLIECQPQKQFCQCPEVPPSSCPKLPSPEVPLPVPLPPPVVERLPKDRKEAMRLVSAPKELADDLSLPDLLVAIEQEIVFLESQPGYETWVFGDRVLGKQEYLKGLRRFVALLGQVKTDLDRPAFFAAVEQEFDFYEVFGQKDFGQTFITGYYEPVIKGSAKKKKGKPQALYYKPDDLVVLDLSLFDGKYKSERKLRGRVKNQQFVPYFTREEIDEKGALRKKDLEICFVDPIDAYNLQTEGSGIVEFEDGTSIHLTAADKNGHRYTGYSRELVRKARGQGLSVEQLLRSLSKKEMRKFLDENPSYVFFTKSEHGENTTLGVSAKGGRTIATDARFFPKGALGFLISSSKTFPADVEVPASVPAISRFVLDEDTGGKILGGGRVDLFFGTGKEAKKQADVTKQWGILYYLVPKVTSAAEKIELVSPQS